MIKPYYSDALVTLYCGDCREILPQIVETHGQIDHMISDPPYARHVGAELPGKLGKLRDGKPRVRDLGYCELSRSLVIATVEAAQYVQRWTALFSDDESTPLWRVYAQDPEHDDEILAIVRERLIADGLFGEPRRGLRYVRKGLWRRIGTTPQFSGDRPGVGHEAINIFGRKGTKLRWNGGGKAAVWSHPIVGGSSGERKDARGHATPKPLSLMRELVADFTDVGETILDQFAGSGSTLIAAQQLGRRSIGVELEEHHCATIVKRLQQKSLLGWAVESGRV